MNHDGAVTFDTGLDNSGIEKDIKETEGCFGGLEKTANAAAKAIKSAFSSAQKEIVKAQEQIRSAEDAKMPLIDQAIELENRLEEAKAKLADLQSQQASAKAALDIPTDRMATGEEIDAYMTAQAQKPELDAAVEQQQQLVNKLQSQWNQVDKQILNYDAKINMANGKIALHKANVEELFYEAQKVQAEASGWGPAWTKAFDVMKKAAKGFGNTVSKAMSGAKKIANGFAKIVGSIKDRFSGAGKSASGFGSRLKSIVSGAFVFNLISAALRKVTDYLGNAIGSTEEMKGAMANLKGAAANAAAPIISVLTPALAALANAAATVFSYLAKLISFFTGKSISAASTASQQIESTAGAAKKAMKSLAGFDEITKLDDKDSSGGGGSDAADVNYDFQGKIPFLDSIMQSIQEGDWQQVGITLAEKLNEVVGGIDAVDVGTKIGGFVNNFVSVLAGFFNKADFSGIVRYAGEKLTPTFATIDWSNVGSVLGGAITALPSMIVGFLEGTDWTVISSSLTTCLSTAFGTVSTWFASVDWFNLGDAIYQTIVNTDWAGVAKSLFSAFGAALGAGVSALWGFIDGAIADVSEYFSEKIEECGGDIIGGLLQGILDAIVGIGEWLVENVFKPFIEGFKKAFGINSPAKQLVEPGENIIKGALTGILNVLASIGTWINQNIFAPFMNAFKTAFGTTSGSSTKMNAQGKSVMNGLLDGIKAAWTAIPTFLSNAFNSMKHTISNIWKNGILPAVKGPVNGIIGCINGMIRGITTGINTVIRALNRLKFTIPSWVPAFGGKSFGFNLSTISTPSIPYLAQGAVLPANKPFLAMVGDQRHGTNVEAPLATIQEAVAAVMGDQVAAMMAGFDALVAENQRLRQIVENIELGDTTIGQAANRYQQKVAVMRGG